MCIMKNFERSLAAGSTVGFVFLVLSFSSIFMVTGDGSAPKFTHIMLALNEFPFKIAGIRAPTAMLFIAAAFWGLLTALTVFIVSAIGRALGSRQ